MILMQSCSVLFDYRRRAVEVGSAPLVKIIGTFWGGAQSPFIDHVLSEESS